jgi:hypothetical protein
MKIRIRIPDLISTMPYYVLVKLYSFWYYITSVYKKGLLGRVTGTKNKIPRGSTMKNSIGWVNVYQTPDGRNIISAYPKATRERSIKSRTKDPVNRLVGTYEIFTDISIAEELPAYWKGYRMGYLKGCLWGVIVTTVVIVTTIIIELGVPIY